ncbi:uncharacterized protein LOC128961954 isoform X2 [Oppia nitens]|uniref:uncharacterized protein LOC128961954 isoform X2 n=1 Tax=Oppia nitens TaxID=1686743 RepID=UPI0023DB5899|nr:uncharacterized protein LOC128961954 isoform X2 [Oppia nitens]
MRRSGTTSASPLSPQSRSQSKPIKMWSPCGQSIDDDMNEMPVLTPEIPFDTVLESQSMGTGAKTGSYADLVPPVLEPALDGQSDSTVTSSGEKCRNKRKSKVEIMLEDDDFSNNLQQLTEYNGINGKPDGQSTAKRSKYSAKKSTANQLLCKSKKLTTKLVNKKSLLKDKSKKVYHKDFKLYNYQQKRPKLKKKMTTNVSNEWSINSNHTMSSLSMNCLSNGDSSSMVKYNNKSSDETINSFIPNNTIFYGNSLKLKSKSLINSQLKKRSVATSPPKRSLLELELLTKQKPLPDEEAIEGIVFKTFETEDEITLFSKFEQLEKEKKEGNLVQKTYKIKSLKTGKLIFPTKTKDITKIKGWREKLFSTVDDDNDRVNKRPFCVSFEKSMTGQVLGPITNDKMGSQSSMASSKSAFVSDLLDGYLKTKSDLKLNYLNSDFAPPPEDSPIFLAGVLKMPDISSSSSMPPPATSSTFSQFSPLKKKGNFLKGRSKGLKNKLKLKTDFSDSIGFLEDEEVSGLELLLPQYPVIRETLWPDTPQSDEQMRHLYNNYINSANQEMELMKKTAIPSFIMDDQYSRFALSVLQCNERIPDHNDNDNNEDCGANSLLLAVGLTPKQNKEMSPVKETKITGRYRKDREADLAMIIAKGNRSKRQIRLPSRFHNSSLLMGNQWVIPDYDSKGKTGKRRLQEEQRRLQELHQRQLEMEQKYHPSATVTTTSVSCFDDIKFSLIHKCLPNNNKPMKMKTKTMNQTTNKSLMKSDYQLKIPKLPLMRPQNQIKVNKSKNGQQLQKSFTSLFSMSKQTMGDKRVVSLSAKAQASATQRAYVNQLFDQLLNAMNVNRSVMIGKNGKPNKVEVIKEAQEMINKLNKREQQLSYIRKLLSMWNHKLRLCDKVAQKGMKPEAYKVVSEVMSAYKDSMCYKVGEALEEKRREFNRKRSQMLSKNNSVKQCSDNANSHLINTSHSSPIQTHTIPIKLTTKSSNPSNQRLLMPTYKSQLTQMTNKSLTENNETVLSVSTSNKYPKLTPPDLQHKALSKLPADTTVVRQESSLLKPPHLTTRPTILTPFMVSSDDDKSVSGPVIKIPNLDKYKAYFKPKSMIASKNFNANTQRKSPPNNSIPNGAPASTSSTSTMPTNGQSNQSVFSPHSYASKSVIITSETPLDNEDLNKIVASITANPDVCY